MTVRLLADYKQYPVNTIVTLDAGTEAGLVAAKLADTNLAGGVQYVPPVMPNQRYPAQIEVDPAGNTIGVVGADGKVIRPGSSGTTLGVIGDSRDDTAFVLIAFATSSPQSASNSCRTLKWALSLSGQPFRRVADFAKSGSGMGVTVGTASVHPTFPEQLASVLAIMPAYCWIRVPINDILTGSNAAAVWPAFKSLVDTVLAAGIRVELVLSTLMDSTKAGYDAVAQAQIIKLNDLVRAAYGSAGALGVALHDTAAAAMQQGVTTYAGIAGAYADNVHFTNIGAYLEAQVISSSWQARFKPLPLLGRYAGDAYRGVPADFNSVGSTLASGASANYLSNGLFDLGAPVSGVAQGWSVVSATNCSYAASIVPAPLWDGNTDGKGQQLAITATAANASLTLESPNMAGDIKLMKQYLAAALVTVAPGASNLQNVRMDLRVSTNITFTANHGFLNSGDDAIPALNTNGGSEVAFCDLDLSLRPDLTATGGGNYFRLRIVISFGSAANGSATITLSRAACRLVN